MDIGTDIYMTYKPGRGDLDTGHEHGLRAWTWTWHGISDVQKRAGKTEDYVVFIGFFSEE
jgi:hypothetical protein